MKRRIGLPVIFATLCLAGATSAQTAFVAPNGQITAGVSKRADVDRALGAPTKQESATLFDYKPPSGAASLQVSYRADGTVSYISATFSQAYARNDLAQGLGLPSQPQPTNVVQNRLREYFGAPAYLVFTYASNQNSSGVVMLRYDSAEAFAAEAPGAAGQLPAFAPPASNGPPSAQPLIPAAPPSNAPPLTGPSSPSGAAPAMWEKQIGAPNQSWMTCAGAAPKAMAALGFKVRAVKDRQGNQRIFYSDSGGTDSAMINCASVGTTAVSIVTSASRNGLSDAQNVANRLAALVASPGNIPQGSPNPSAAAAPGMEQRQQGVANQQWSDCGTRVQTALAPFHYNIGKNIDGLGFETDFYVSAQGPSAVAIGCSQVGTTTLYTVTGASSANAANARNAANAMYNLLFPTPAQ